MTKPASLPGWAREIEGKFASAIAEFGLRVVAFDDEQAFLIGTNFILDIAAERDGVEIDYLERAADGELHAYSLRHLLKARFSPRDRDAHLKHGEPMGVAARRSASLDYYVSITTERCRDLLAGDKSWLDRDRDRTVRRNDLVVRALRGEPR